jgi:hypothetical protein
MKIFISGLFVMVLFFLSCNSVFAQAPQGNIIVMTNFERAFPENGMGSELDSLATIMVDNSYKNNPYVVSYKVFRHFWGHNSADFIQMIEVKNWDDINKAEDEGNKQFMKAMPNKADRDKFNKAFNKYFTGRHSDEIYMEVDSGK